MIMITIMVMWNVLQTIHIFLYLTLFISFSHIFYFLFFSCRESWWGFEGVTYPGKRKESGHFGWLSNEWLPWAWQEQRRSFIIRVEHVNRKQYGCFFIKYPKWGAANSSPSRIKVEVHLPPCPRFKCSWTTDESRYCGSGVPRHRLNVEHD